MNFLSQVPVFRRLGTWALKFASSWKYQKCAGKEKVFLKLLTDLVYKKECSYVVPKNKPWQHMLRKFQSSFLRRVKLLKFSLLSVVSGTQVNLKKYLKLSSYLLFWNECNNAFFQVLVKRSQWHFIPVNRVTTNFLCLQTSL